jgi:hypothetical protein
MKLTGSFGPARALIAPAAGRILSRTAASAKRRTHARNLVRFEATWLLVKICYNMEASRSKDSHMKHALATAIFMASAILAAPSFSALPGGDGPSANSQVSRDRIVCRRFLRTGSLVDSYRTCKTNREWRREHENVQHLATSDSCGLRGEGGAGCNP